MNPKILLFALMVLCSKQLFGQARLRKMPPNINQLSTNNYAPYISFDGNTMVYIADVAEDNALTLNYTAREGVNWKDPVILPKSVNNRLNFMKGYALSADGKTIYISNAKGNGLGGFDLYTGQLVGNNWKEPVNMGLPLNSKAHEGCPSVSAEGNLMFFMRCEKMDFEKADNCKLMVTRKMANGEWDAPVDLPSFINTGNSQTPRIMGDGETLVFSSNKLLPNKGGMDLYVTRLSNGQWSNPQPLDFVNTPADDQYVSATALGRYLVRDAPGERRNELIEILFPTEVRPKSTMKIEGTVTSAENTSAYVSVFKLKDQSRVLSTKPGNDGNFIAYIKEGDVYELSVEPEKDNYTFFSKHFDLTGEKIPQLEKVSVNLKPVATGDEILLEGISFNANSTEISSTSTQELRRLVRMIQGNSDKSFSISVTLAGYQKDSVRSSPDLTEVIIDSLKIPVTYKIDSVTTGKRDSIVIKKTYHNDRTPLQAKELGDYLVKQGIPAGRLNYSGKALPEAILENRKTTVKVIIR